MRVWDQSSGPGGRFATHDKGGGPAVDLGAQYITEGAGRDPDSAVYADLEEAGVIAPFTAPVGVRTRLGAVSVSISISVFLIVRCVCMRCVCVRCV